MNPFTTEARIRARIGYLNACRKDAGVALAGLSHPPKGVSVPLSCLRKRQRELLTLIRDCRRRERALRRMTSDRQDQKLAARSRGTLTLFA